MKKKKTLLIISASITVLLLACFIYTHLENTTIKTTEISIADSKIPRGFDGCRIVQVSDLHNTQFGKDNRVLLDKIKESNPDVILITGDLIDASKTDMDVAVGFIEQAVEIAPIYFVTGNHEAAVKEYPEFEEKIESLGVNVLDNSFVQLKRGGSKLNLVGLADPSFVNGFWIDTASVFGKHLSEMDLDLSNYTVLLSHRPELFDFYAESGIDLVFSGHAHGGQFRLPFIGGVVAPDQGLFPKYTSGVYEKDSTKMIVSRGLGNSIIPFRINNNPQLIVAVLESN